MAFHNAINYLKQLANKKYFFLVLFIFIAIVISFQQIAVKEINNFIIFRTSLPHLIEHQNLYCGYLPYYRDMFLYNPSFIILFSPFFVLPLYMGLVLWVLFICLVYYYTIRQLFPKPQQIFIFLFCLMEFVTSTQSLQMNATLACFMLLTYLLLEKDRPVLASLMVALGLFIKVYPGLAALLFLLYPNKIKFIIWGAIWVVLIMALPLFIVSFDELVSIYQQWFHSLSSDNSLDESSKSLSLVGILFKWFSHPPMRAITLQFTGLGILCIPFFYFTKYKNKIFRILLLSSIMLFVVLFNHASESPTYIIAVIACCVWYLNSPRQFLDKLLMVVLFLFTVLISTDIYPLYWRSQYFVPLCIKTIPVLLIWLKLQYDLFTLKNSIE